MKALLAFLLCPVFFISASRAQNNSNIGIEPDPLVEQLLEFADQDNFESQEAFEAYLADLIEIFPIDINRASRDKLRLIPAVSEKTIVLIDEYRGKNDISSLDELLEIHGIGPVTLEQLRPWLTADHGSSGLLSLKQDLTIRQLFRYQQTLQKAAGYTNENGESPHYLGHPFRLQHRQQISGSRFSGNLTQVKLPGEPFYTPLGFDFTSGNISMRDTGPLNNLIIGDYSARFGQGLVMWSSATFGKGGAAHTAPFRRSQGITPYGSSGQSRYLRGIAAEITLPLPIGSHRSSSAGTGKKEASDRMVMAVTGFHSVRKRSAVEIQGDTIRPPSLNPYHRTENEVLRRNNSKERVTGGNLTLRNQRWTAGVTYTSYELNRPVIPATGSAPFRGSDNRIIGSDFTIYLSRFRIFGEYARRLRHVSNITAGGIHAEKVGSSENYRTRSAWTTGLSGIIGKAEWIFSKRYYARSYWSESGSGFGEGSGPPNNQSGWYAGFRLRPSSKIQIQGFLDRFHFPDPIRNNIRTTSGYEPMLSISHRLSSEFSYYLRIRYKKRESEREVLDDYLRKLRVSSYETRMATRFQFNWHITNNLFLRSQYDRVISNRMNQKKNKGNSLTIVIRTHFRNKWRFDLGLTAFQTDNYSSRVHVYEHDLTHAMASSMLYGTGQRSYIVIRYQLISAILAEFKYSRIRYFDRAYVGTGHDMTSEPQRSAIGVQIIIQY